MVNLESSHFRKSSQIRLLPSFQLELPDDSLQLQYIQLIMHKIDAADLCCVVISDDVGSRSVGGDKRAEYHDDNEEEFTLERTCTKTTEKITSNRKTRLSRRDMKDDPDQRVSQSVD